MIIIILKIKEIIREAVGKALDISLNLEEINIDIPQKKHHGHLSTNIAMTLSQGSNSKSREIAEKIKKHMTIDESNIKEIKVMGPGFINLYLKEKFYIDELFNSIESKGYLSTASSKSEHINVALVLNDINDILKLHEFRTFMNMYYLSNIYRFIGSNTAKLIVVNKNKVSLATSYFLTNFQGLEITMDKNKLKDCIIFSSSQNQLLLKENQESRNVVEGVNIYDNGVIQENPTLDELIERIGINRFKYTLCTKPYSTKINIDLSENKLKHFVYIYERIASIIKIFKDEGLDIENGEKISVELLTDPLEVNIISKLWEFEQVLKAAIYRNDTYSLIRFAEELSDAFHELNDDTLFRELKRDKCMALLKLLNYVSIIIEDILSILEIDPRKYEIWKRK